ncbi:O-methylsterigmatocystin oxidoreductase [Lecanosticta acicola]|uniref:O-methylsterigmatocystin oxidoreductase n=1 Tax=Lecanosticta acicola TaxID=111012 RepID=A0AAI8Z6V4_9PEZI|nr:O-methylsterigmatocystin oxidoreductase [Lecanosticta acicola]
MSPTISALVACLATGLIYVLLYVGRREKNLPPGPPTVPLLGNILHIPSKGAHFYFTKLARQYGAIFSLKLGTGTAVVITDRRLVKELLDKRSSKYSERPTSYVAHLVSGGDHVLLMQYGPQWRDTRKLLHGSFMEKVVEDQHLPLQEAEARQMIRDYLLDPEQHMLHPKRFSNSIIMSLVWGIRTPHWQTRHMERLYSLLEIWSKVMETGATPPVDVYPFMHYLPQSLFLNWVDRATHVQREMNSLYSDFLRDIRTRRSKGGSRGTFMDRILDQADSENRLDGLTHSDHELWFIGGSITEGGSDTTASMLTAFVQAMAAYPEIQRKAQAQIDSVIGSDRSPTWRDYQSLPYVAQCVKETMRWRPVTPLAFPHALTEDDWIDGMFLPKGTVVIVNAWGMHHDENLYQNPEHFDPDHFKGCTTLATELGKGPCENRDHYGYGTGRRFCPGAHIAERNMFLAMSKILWAFDISPGPNGIPDTDPVTGYCEGFLVCANDFEAQFNVRGDRRETILAEFESSKGKFEQYESTGEETA